MPGIREHKMEQMLEAMERGVVTAEVMARHAGCSERTVYRYVSQMRAKGHKILSGSGYGYLLKRRAEGCGNG